jgi:hypothetical protein
MHSGNSRMLRCFAAELFDPHSTDASSDPRDNAGRLCEVRTATTETASETCPVKDPPLRRI